MVLLFSGAHLARMIFHPFLAAHASAKMLFTSTGSTDSADTRTLLAYSMASSTTGQCGGPMRRLEPSAKTHAKLGEASAGGPARVC